MNNKKTPPTPAEKPKRKLTFHDDDFKRKVIAEYLDVL
jgi:hypothetical protein